MYPSVDVSLQQFQDDITDFEWRLGCLLCRVWDDCPAAEAAGKLLEMFGFMLERPLIRQQLRHKSLRLVRLLSGELERAERLLDGRREAGGAAGKNLPPAAGRLARAHHLRQRVQTAMRSYEAVRHLCLDSEEAELLLRQYDRTSVLLRQYCDAVYSDWSGRVDADCDFGLEQSVMLRSRDDLLRVNFTPQLAAVLREVKYLQAQRNVPPRAAEIFSRRQTFRKNICSLELLVSCYNQVVSSVSVEFPLVQQQLQEVQEKLTEAERLTWSCEGWQLIQQIREQLCEFHCRLSRARANMDAMTRSIQAWSVSPLLERTGGQTDSLLDLEGGAQLDRRYTQIRESGAELLRLTQENRELLGAEPAESWVRYLDHIDDKVLDGFFQLLSISLHFLSDNMNPESGGAPLLCVCVQLQEAECVLSCRLTDRLKSLLDQIYTAAELIHPLSVCRDPHQLALQQQVELCVLRGEVLRRGQEVQEEAERLREQLDRFSFLWQDDRQEVMQQFLTYGRVPSPEELEAEAPPPAAPPTLQDFSREVESYERLRGEASRLDERPVLSGWLRLDLRPFRRSLLSVIQSWRRMFTQHLLESVCSR
ncbi:dynein axonemal heavy chain 17-like [Centroberyx gerrardi]